VFKKYAKYYDLLYQDKNYTAEAEYVASIIKKYQTNAKKILEFGSGSGIHGRLLSKLGYDVSGIERSQEMINIGKLNSDLKFQNSNFRCVQGDCKDTFISNDFDVVISLFHVFSYQISKESIIAIFDNAYKQLKHDGILIFDFWFAPAVWNYRPTLRLKKIENPELKITRIAEPQCWEDKNRVDVNYITFVEDLSSGQISKIEEIHKMRAFDLNEISKFGTSAGFDLLHSEEWLSRQSPSPTTWGVCSVLGKSTSTTIE
jgi:SAM-dependent methyltransferase